MEVARSPARRVIDDPTIEDGGEGRGEEEAKD